MMGLVEVMLCFMGDNIQTGEVEPGGESSVGKHGCTVRRNISKIELWWN